MSTQQQTVDYIMDQLEGLGQVSCRKMFGEYALYCDGMVVALVCDDSLFVKITDAGKAFVGTYYREGFAYKGAKVSMNIDEDRIEDREWLSELIYITKSELVLQKQKKKVKKSKK